MTMAMVGDGQITAPVKYNRHDQVLGRALLTAVLLTRSAQQGEASVLEAIRWFDLEAMSSDDLIFMVARAAVTASLRIIADQPIPCLASIVPEQLRGVLTLPLELRQCFVLRLLLKVPQHDCASILQIAPRDVNRLAAQAAVLLAVH